MSRHDTALMRKPPTKGPMAVATPPRPDQAPMARARSSGANEAWRMARDPGVSRAPPTPCRARPAMRTPASGATAQTSDGEREPRPRR